MNINIIEKRNNSEDKPISKLFLKNKINNDNIKVENSFCYEEMLAIFLSETKHLKLSNENFFSQSVNAKLLFDTVYDFFKDLDDELFHTFCSLFINKDKNVIFIPNNPLQNNNGVTYLNKNNISIKIFRYKTIEDIFTLVHEYGHAINMKKHPNLYNNNVRNDFEEIESIFLELILCDFLENYGFDKVDVQEVRKQIVENLIDDTNDLYFKYQINKFIHQQGIKNIDNEFYRELYRIKNISKSLLREKYRYSFDDLAKYVIGTLYSFELYDRFQLNKSKTISMYKEITNLDLYTNMDYIDVMESKLIVPNESDAFIRTLKK